jgi:hypothetical protein
MAECSQLQNLSMQANGYIYLYTHWSELMESLGKVVMEEPLS